MPSQALVEAHRTELGDIVAVAQAELVEQWSGMPLDDAMRTRRVLADTIEDLVYGYGTLAAGAAADFYIESRADDGVRGRMTPRLVVPVVREQIDINAGWAVGPLFGETDASKALARTSGVVQRLTANADRMTIIGAAQADPVDVRWYRGASSTACSFCALLASRAVAGIPYRSESSASFDSHASCRCFPVPMFTQQRIPPDLPDYYDQFYKDYEAAGTAVEAEGGKMQLKPVLKQMRVISGRS